MGPNICSVDDFETTHGAARVPEEPWFAALMRWEWEGGTPAGFGRAEPESGDGSGDEAQVPGDREELDDEHPLGF
jgi:hypothetical protein